MPSLLKRALKFARDFPPINTALTYLSRWLFGRIDRIVRVSVRHLPRKGIVRVTLPNDRTLVLRADDADPIPSELFWHGWDGYETGSAHAFFALAQRAGCVIDVGAHSGLYALLAAHAHPSARVIAVEPMPATFERLKANVARNRVANVTCVRAALGRKRERRALYYYEPGLPFVASFSEQFVRGRAPGTARVRHDEVDVLLLDELVGDLLPTVDLVKLDCEGHELAVLQGGRATLEASRPTILMEVLPGADCEALEALLRPYGYRFRILSADGPIEVPRIVPYDRCPNYLLTVGPEG